MTQSEEYKMGYQDALAKIKNEIEQRIAERENSHHGIGIIKNYLIILWKLLYG